jgi:two-component system response regulator GlrR
MVIQETKSIAVFGSTASELESLIDVIRQAGAWGIVPIQWPNVPALVAARHTAEVYVLCSGTSSGPVPCDELQELLGARPNRAPLIVVGSDASARAAPDLWLPSVPKPALFGALISQLIDLEPADSGSFAASSPSWRRKTDMIIGSSAPIRQLLHSLDQLAPAQTPVLITGESGVGKELVARALHFCGPRAKEPFIAINCAAIPENLFEAELFGYQRGAFTGAVNAHAGAFEAAHKGTLFLDEIGEMPQGMQAKLLRVLETSEVQRIGSTDRKKVNFRLVTATNRNLEKEVAQGRFREDLYYRVQVYPLHVAPLRERPEDIPQLVTHHLSVIGMRENRPSLRLTSAALEKMISYRWPGNVRELVNLLERATLLADNRVIDAEHVTFPSGLSPEPASLLPYRDAKAKFELDYYSQLMRTAGGNVSLAAKLGQKTRKEIYDALKRSGLDAADFTPPSPRRRKGSDTEQQ